jgi:hypothetical protein
MARPLSKFEAGHDSHRAKAGVGVHAAAQQGGAVMSTDRIRELNDAFRKSFSGGKVIMTAGVYELPDMVKCAALHETATFNGFNEDNDSHGEHDFGSFELCSRKFFWKIDYYDDRCESGSEDPSDPKKTTRVLTLMLAEEY